MRALPQFENRLAKRLGKRAHGEGNAPPGNAPPPSKKARGKAKIGEATSGLRGTSVTCTLAFSNKAKGKLSGGHHVLLSTDYKTIVIVKDSPYGCLLMGDCARASSTGLHCARASSRSSHSMLARCALVCAVLLLADATVAHGNLATYEGSRMVVNAYTNRLSVARVADGADDEEPEEEQQVELSPYEEERQRSIELNHSKLRELGLI